jgi:hypothetical protein
MMLPYGAIISCEARNAPVDGVKLSLVDVVFTGRFPVFAVTQVG